MKNLHHFVVPRWVVNITGGGNPAILFARILHWHRADKNGAPRLGPDEDGRPRAWCPGYQGIERETGLNKQQIRRGLRKLESAKRIAPPTQDDDGRTTRLRLRFTKRMNALLRQRGLLENEKAQTEERNQPRILISPEHVRAAGGGNPALVLAEIVRSYERSRKAERKMGGKIRNGRWWIAMSDQDLVEKTGLGPWQVKRAMKALLDNKHHFLLAERDLSGSVMTRYVRLNRVALARAVAEACGKEEEEGQGE